MGRFLWTAATDFIHNHKPFHLSHPILHLDVTLWNKIHSPPDIQQKQKESVDSTNIPPQGTRVPLRYEREVGARTLVESTSISVAHHRLINHSTGQ